MPPEVAALVARMRSLLAGLEDDGDPARYFLGTYLRTTEAVGAAYSLAGSTSLYETSRLERAFRDVNSAVKHITLAPQHFEMVGQYLVGGGLRLRR